MGARLSSPSPLDDDDLLREILLRLPPQPSTLPRASLVCTRWRAVLSDPHFLGRFRKLHQNPPLLGFFAGDFGTPHVFAPILGSPNRTFPARFSVPPWQRLDIERQTLAVINKPVGVHGKDCWSFQLLRTSDDGSLGLAVMSKLSIQLWKRQSDSNGVVEWVRPEKIIHLEWLFPQKMDSALKVALMVGYDEDSNAVVLATDIGVFMLQIESMQFRTVSKTYTRDSKIFYPYRNFYTAGRYESIS
ncbi:unnamed protein product [Alopecurus aequalis]